MLWSPPGYHLADPTIIRVGEEYHLFTEATSLSEPQRGPVRVYHAVSKDLRTWSELPICIEAGSAGAFDAYMIYHMDVVVHGGVWHMFYTGLDKPGAGQQQATGLATSRDGITWTKHPSNPVVRADPRFYEPLIPLEAAYQAKDAQRLWFRDPCVVPDPATGGFGMIVMARDLTKPLDLRGCLSWSTSRDLVQWDNHGPCFSPGRFHTIETPSIFQHGGRHYVIYMTHRGWGTPYLTTDPYQTDGNFYAVSERGPAGPYRALDDEVLVAAHGGVRFGAQRTVDTPDGGRLLYGWLEPRARRGDSLAEFSGGRVMPTLKPLRFEPDGRIRVTYPKQIEERATPVGALGIRSAPPVTVTGEGWRADAGAIVGKCFRGPSFIRISDPLENFVFSATVTIGVGERAGLICRVADDLSSGWYVAADRALQRVEFGAIGDPSFIDARAWRIGARVELKVAVERFSVEVYADGCLVIHQVRHQPARGCLGLMVDHAEAIFEECRALSLPA